MIRVGVALGVLAVLVSACGPATVPAVGPAGTATEAPSAPITTRTAGPEITGTGMETPPPYRLQYDDHELVLRPHTWCYDTGCVDGVLQTDPPSVGSPDAIRVRVPVQDWDLTATFTPAGQRCGRMQSVQPKSADGWYLLEPVGRAATYDVTLFARGGGDMVAAFRWRTPYDGPLATPEARLALIAEHDGRPDSYGVELELVNLARTPSSLSARITVTAANGRSLTFDATRARGRCWPEGTAYFDGPDASGLAAADLGEMPFHYRVIVMIDGATYRADADYPDDEIKGNEPSVTLEFTPSLPALE